MRYWLVYRTIPLALVVVGVASLDFPLNFIRPMLLNSIAIMTEYVLITINLFR